MRRADFLAHVGDPASTEMMIEAIGEHVRFLWDAAGGSYCPQGTPRLLRGAKTAEQQDAARRIKALRSDIQSLGGLLHDQRVTHRDEWSHVSPWVARRWGLNDLAARIDALRLDFYARCEALEP